MLAAVLLGVAEMELENRAIVKAAGITVAKKAGKYRGRKPGTETKADGACTLELRAKGLKVREIAGSLGVSWNTVLVYLRDQAGASNAGVS